MTDAFGNSLRAWTTAAFAAAAAGTLLLAIRTIAVGRLARLASQTETSVDDVAVDILKRVRWYFVLAISLFLGARFLTMPGEARSAVRWGLLLAVILQVGVWGNGVIAWWLRHWAERRGADAASSTTVAAFGFLARAVLWLILALVGLQNAGFDVSTLVTGLGVTGIAVALAVQNILGDLFAALSIVLDKPFLVGDTIAVDAITGTVEHIGLKTTRVRALSGEQVIFSNADLLRSRVRNLKRMVERRVAFTVGVTTDTPPEKVARLPGIICSVIDATPLTRFERSHFVRIGESALEVETVYWVTDADYAAFPAAQEAINLGLLRAFAAAQVDFALPTRSVVVKGSSSAENVAAAGA